MSWKILLAEDDQDLGTMLKRYLELNNFQIKWEKDGEKAYQLFQEEDFDICILDVMMPRMDGFSLAKKIVTIKPEMPFLFLTARKTKEDRIKGLKLGADDYIAKPFEAEELILRIKNIVKRVKQQSIIEPDDETNSIIDIGNYTFDYRNLELRIDNTMQRLTAKEAKLIYYLNTNKNQLIKRDEILAHVWNKTDFFSGRSMDVFISRVRKYFKKDPSIRLQSVRGIGLEFNINAK
ncbi:response regulator transcription factor [Cochleicola gelatinilyticus]|uniref:Two-component system response regulator n=1 Tax=Cochleicola gelatinilyticus TaxID=1763537 RepID=A0A167GVX5_9FLAO|nr:response regulator transcription factor [Cochleicola gelatinilyticus]OAB77958.1 two-component system response regulator [Cochleicola gelatinilyticus]